MTTNLVVNAVLGTPFTFNVDEWKIIADNSREALIILAGLHADAVRRNNIRMQVELKPVLDVASKRYCYALAEYLRATIKGR